MVYETKTGRTIAFTQLGASGTPAVEKMLWDSNWVMDLQTSRRLPFLRHQLINHKH